MSQILSTQKGSPFLDLPPELRHHIYSFLVGPDNHSIEGGFFSGHLRLKYHLEILRASREIYVEASDIIFREIGPIITVTFRQKDLHDAMQPVDYPLYLCPNPHVITQRQLHVDVGQNCEDFETREIGSNKNQEGPRPSVSFAVVGEKTILHFTHTLGEICPCEGFRFWINPLANVEVSDLIRLFAGFQTHSGTRSTVDCICPRDCQEFEDFLNDNFFWTNGESLRAYSLALDRFKMANGLLAAMDFEAAAIEYQNMLSLIHRIRVGESQPTNEFGEIRDRLLAKVFRNILWAYIGMGKYQPQEKNRKVWLQRNMDIVRSYIAEREYLDGGNLFWLLGLLRVVLYRKWARPKQKPTKSHYKKILEDLSRASKNQTCSEFDNNKLQKTLGVFKKQYRALMSAQSSTGTCHLEDILSEAPQPCSVVPEPFSVSPVLEERVLREYQLLKKLDSKRIDGYEAAIRAVGLASILSKGKDTKPSPELLQQIKSTEPHVRDDAYQIFDFDGLIVQMRFLPSQSSHQRTILEF
ncbi:hypothetical protein TWF192_005746 [Orbilia oligospora]|uniref:Uncharacterized protein n=1 Tax=Orbilia oligospora TaxID=2813651 RepID=A0A6G1MMN8_ORBOL|nr:hypothetical protein TWF191_003894 [Orbilia oligospora]KAF3263465.1 hypothetical protein TWF192_005746 [Orbilia oligospora]